MTQNIALARPSIAPASTQAAVPRAPLDLDTLLHMGVPFCTADFPHLFGHASAPQQVAA